MKPLVIYHNQCTDGFAAAWCFHHKDPAGYDFHGGVYGVAPPDVAGRDVFLVDFSYKKDVLLAMALTAKSITVLDHHASAQADLQNFKPGSEHCPTVVHFDMERSGATMAWDYLFPDQDRPLLLNNIEDRDLWRFKLDFSRELHAAVNSHEWTFEMWDEFMSASPTGRLHLAVAGKAILRKHDIDVKDICRTNKRRLPIGGYMVVAANVPGWMASDAGHLLGQGEPFAACYWDTETHRVFSLRSRPEGLDVSLIAGQYDGGGHKHAAGFKVSRDHALARA